MILQTKKYYLTKNNFQQIKPKAIFFDMDGILFNSMPSHSIAWVKAMNESGLPFTELESYMFEGQPGADTVNYIFEKKYGRESTKEERTNIYLLKSKYFDELGEPQRIPYVYDLLKKLKREGFQILVVTGSAHPTLLNNLQTYFPGIFEKENIISAFDVKQGKPNPDPYLEALKRAGVSPWEALVVENAPLGVKASSTAEIFTIGVNTGPLDKNMLLDYGANIVFDSMEDLYKEWDNLLLNLKSSHE